MKQSPKMKCYREFVSFAPSVEIRDLQNLWAGAEFCGERGGQLEACLATRISDCSNWCGDVWQSGIRLASDVYLAQRVARSWRSFQLVWVFELEALLELLYLRSHCSAVCVCWCIGDLRSQSLCSAAGRGFLNRRAGLRLIEHRSMGRDLLLPACMFSFSRSGRFPSEFFLYHRIFWSWSLLQIVVVALNFEFSEQISLFVAFSGLCLRSQSAPDETISLLHFLVYVILEFESRTPLAFVQNSGG